jgi:hypothetical protein
MLCGGNSSGLGAFGILARTMPAGASAPGAAAGSRLGWVRAHTQLLHLYPFGYRCISGELTEAEGFEQAVEIGVQQLALDSTTCDNLTKPY